MTSTQLIIIAAAIIGLGALGLLLYLFFRGTRSEVTGLSSLMGTEKEYLRKTETEAKVRNAKSEDEVAEILRRTGSSKAQKEKNDVATRLYRAGYYSEADRRYFKRLQVVAPIIAVSGMFALAWWLLNGLMMLVLAVVMGVFIGYAWPLTWIDRQTRKRDEELMYFLPLVIEQVAIGVSSSLDIGPCIAQIVQMANERDSHNPITELFIQVEKLIRSGLNLEDALMELGEANGVADVKHAFMFLAQCSKHGGEISRQLQELADSTMTQRQVQVEGRITSLPVKATGPLATVFGGFFALIFAGLLIRLMTAFSGAGH